jgi:hypothetical protein
MRAFVNVDHDYEYDLMLLDPKSTSLGPFNLLILIDPAILGATAAAAEAELLVGQSANSSPNLFAKAITEALAEHLTTTETKPALALNNTIQMPPPLTNQAFNSKKEAQSFVNNFIM